MKSYRVDNLAITLDKQGSSEFLKVSYPIRYGRFAEIRTPDYIFQFNLNGEIKYIQGRNRDWPHPAEWLKRTAGNDWVYYSAGDYKGIYGLFGEYYFPCLSYPSNSIMDDHPFHNNAVNSAFGGLRQLQSRIKELISSLTPQDLKDFLTHVAENDAEALGLRSQVLHGLIGGQVTVLPPDSRHVDYEVIPVVVADGCLYNCGFCRVKSSQDFVPRHRENILEQIKNLKRFYDRDLFNYNAIFLGYHDALCAGRELLEFAATMAYESFQFDHSYLKGTSLFLFGSVDSLIHSEEALFETLNGLPFSTYVNIGFESADSETLALLEKPITVEKVREAYGRMTEINRTYEKIEVTSNFIFGESLSPDHLLSIIELTNTRIGHFYDKGGMYLSPLMNDKIGKVTHRRELLRRFYQVKGQSRIPVFLYLIQRL